MSFLTPALNNFTRSSKGPAGAGGGPSGSPATLSLDFTTANSEYLSMSQANFGAFDLAKWAISSWVKIQTQAVTATIMECRDAAAFRGFSLSMSTSTRFIDYRAWNDSPNTAARLATNNSVAPFPGWFHIYATFDSANATADDRMKLYIDGVEITTFAARTNPTNSIRVPLNEMRIGRNNATVYTDALLYDTAFFEGDFPSVGTLYNAGTPPDITGLANLHSLHDPDTAVTADHILAAAWTDNNTVQTNVDIP